MNTGKKGTFVPCDEKTLEEFHLLCPTEEEKELFFKVSLKAYGMARARLGGIKKGLITNLIGKIHAHFLHEKGNGF